MEEEMMAHKRVPIRERAFRAQVRLELAETQRGRPVYREAILRARGLSVMLENALRLWLLEERDHVELRLDAQMCLRFLAALDVVTSSDPLRPVYEEAAADDGEGGFFARTPKEGEEVSE